MAIKKLKDISPRMMNAIGSAIESVIGENLRYAVLVIDPSTNEYYAKSSYSVYNVLKLIMEKDGPAPATKEAVERIVEFCFKYLHHDNLGPGGHIGQEFSLRDLTKAVFEKVELKQPRPQFTEDVANQILQRAELLVEGDSESDIMARNFFALGMTEATSFFGIYVDAPDMNTELKQTKSCTICKHDLPLEYFSGGIDPDKCYLCDEMPF